MQLSPDVLNFIIALEQYSDGKLRKKNDIGVCFEICASYNGQEELSELIFQSKILWNLSKKIKSIQSEEKGIELLQREFQDSLEKIRNILTEITNLLENEDKTRFEDVYLAMTKGALMNILDLAHDFSIIKDMQKKN